MVWKMDEINSVYSSTRSSYDPEKFADTFDKGIPPP